MVGAGGGGGTHVSEFAGVHQVATGGSSGFAGAFFLCGGFPDRFAG